MTHSIYENPLISRYASSKMAALFSPQCKHSTWRKLWIALAESEAELGLPISSEQIETLKKNVEAIDFDVAAKYEKKLRHDVMAHVHAFGDQCPNAKAILHLGATSCFVTDNADLIILREALRYVAQRLAQVIDSLAMFAAEYRALPTLGFTHMQPAQPTTVGKRATLWAYDFVLDLEALEHRIQSLRFRSTKGTTGTQASFLSLFGNDHTKVTELEKRVAKKMGFDRIFAVTGQTYSRKIDTQILEVLSGIASSAHKMATDIRLLANRKEIEEPFEKKQIGSSAMAYKRNPMRSERICSLARFAMSLPQSAAATHATQWMERTLDDSAIRRLTLPQAFLAIDAVLILCENVTSGLVVYPAVIERNLRQEIPFMATENILLAAAKQGGDRQDLHEIIRQHSVAAAEVVKNQGGENDLLERLAAEKAFAGVDLQSATDASKLIGRSPEQVDEFIAEIIRPIRERYKHVASSVEELRV